MLCFSLHSSFFYSSFSYSLTSLTSDLRSALTRLCYSKNFDAGRPAFVASLPGLLAPFEAWLASRSSSWLASARVSYADFFFYELMAQLLALSPRLRELAPRSAALHDRVHELPALVRYRGSARFAAVAAFNNKSASFRG